MGNTSVTSSVARDSQVSRWQCRSHRSASWPPRRAWQQSSTAHSAPLRWRWRSALRCACPRRAPRISPRKRAAGTLLRCCSAVGSGLVCGSAGPGRSWWSSRSTPPTSTLRASASICEHRASAALCCIDQKKPLGLLASWPRMAKAARSEALGRGQAEAAVHRAGVGVAELPRRVVARLRAAQVKGLAERGPEAPAQGRPPLCSCCLSTISRPTPPLSLSLSLSTGRPSLALLTALLHPGATIAGHRTDTPVLGGKRKRSARSARSISQLAEPQRAAKSSQPTNRSTRRPRDLRSGGVYAGVFRAPLPAAGPRAVQHVAICLLLCLTLAAGENGGAQADPVRHFSPFSSWPTQGLRKARKCQAAKCNCTKRQTSPRCSPPFFLQEIVSQGTQWDQAMFFAVLGMAMSRKRLILPPPQSFEHGVLNKTPCLAVSDVFSTTS